MKKIERISMIGLGAIGCAFAHKLYDMDPSCLKIIADKDRIDRYSKDSFYVNGKPYDFNYISSDEKCEPADLLLISVKYHNLKQTIEDIKNHVGPDTIIISLLNGISSEEILGEAYGMDKILYSMVVAIDAVREGNNVRFTNPGTIVFGEKENKGLSPRVEAVKELFERANISYDVPENIMRSMWWKFMVNVGVNQTSAVLRAPYGVFQKIGEANDLMKLTMNEVIELSKKTGANLNEEDIDEFERILNKLSPEGKTSMLQDIEDCRKTEVEMLAGVVCDLGRKYSVPTPINEALFKMIRIMEQMN